MGSLDVLIRLAEQQVNQERLALQVINAEIAETERRIQGLRDMITSETAAPLDIMTNGSTLSAFVRANNERIQQLEVQTQRLRQRHEIQLERVRNERVEQKRYELLAERRAKQASEQAAVTEQKAIDELVVIKAGRRPTQG